MEEIINQWDTRIKNFGLDIKKDKQLIEIYNSHQNKIPLIEKELYWLKKYPQYKIKELEEEREERETFGLVGLDDEEINDEVQSQTAFYQWKIGILMEIIACASKETELRRLKLVKRNPIGTTYYCDPSTASGQLTGTWTFTNASTAVNAAGADGNATAELVANDYVKISSANGGIQWYKVASVTDNNNFVLSRTFLEANVTDGAGATDYRDVSVAVGTSTANSYVVLDQFTEVALSAGDVCKVRRGKSERISDWSDLTFYSNGAMPNPIIIEADYTDVWGDFVDLSGTGTATLTFGSKTVTFSADISGVLFAGDWIYVSNDNAKDYAYEVASVVTTTVTLYLPYKGGQAGSGKTVYNMKTAPIWNTAAGNYQWNFNYDNYWMVQGIHIRGTDSNGIIRIYKCYGHLFKDCILEGNGATDDCFRIMDNSDSPLLIKCRFYNYSNGFYNTVKTSHFLTLHDCLLDANSVLTSCGFRLQYGETIVLIDCELKNHTTGDIVFGGGKISRVWGRNCIFSSATKVYYHDQSPFSALLSEDHDGVIGDNRQLTYLSIAEGTPSMQSENTTVRSGGGDTSIKVTPSTKLSSKWEHSKIKLFEYPIYASTASKTYTVYFNLPAANFTVAPIASELWIELEAWGHASNIHRKITKSTGTVVADGNWNTLTVTVAPTQVGVSYLRAYYCKTKEPTDSNILYTDTKIEVS